MTFSYNVLISMAWLVLTTLPVYGASLSQTLDHLIAAHTKVDFGVEIVRADSGECLYRHQSSSPLIPASNMKIVTTASALKTLGSDYQFETQVGLENDVLVLVGSGDPLLGQDDREGQNWNWLLLDVARLLQEREIDHLSDIVVDSTCFDDQRIHPNWPAKDLNKGFSSEVCGFNYHGNCIDVTVKNQAGQAVVLLDPPTSYVEIQNKVKIISGKKTGVGAYRLAGQPNVWQVKGLVRREQGPFATPVERPAAFVGYLCAETLAQQGIRVTGQLREQAYVPGPGYTTLATYPNPLEAVLVRCNRDSFNLAAESLVKTLGRHATRSGRSGSWELGTAVMGQYLESLGLSPEEFHLDDGSGLSLENRLSAHGLVQVLLDMYRQETWPMFEHSLAIGGVNGTLDSRFLEKAYCGKIRAKSGYLGDASVRTLSGLCETEDGLIFFSILANGGNIMVRQTITKMAKAIIDCS